MRNWIYNVLSLLAPVLDKTEVPIVNRAAQIFIIQLFVPLFGTYLKLRYRFDNQFRIVLRHSILNNSDYHFLFSDLDMSIVVSNKDISQSELIYSSFNLFKKVFLFMGELEIYTVDEFEIFEKQTNNFYQDYFFLRDVRKIGWIEDENEKLSSVFHRVKYKRSMTKLLNKLGGRAEIQRTNNIVSVVNSLIDWLNQFGSVGNVSADIEFSVFSNYLGFNVSCKKNESGPRTLVMPVQYAALLLAIIPFETNDKELQKLISQIRTNVRINQLNLALNAIEIVVLSAVHRARPQLFPFMPNWIMELKRYYEANSVRGG